MSPPHTSLVFFGISGFCGLQLKTFTAPEAAVEPPSSLPQAASARGTPSAATAMTAQRLRVLTRMVDPSRFAAGRGPPAQNFFGVPRYETRITTEVALAPQRHVPKWSQVGGASVTGQYTTKIGCNSLDLDASRSAGVATPGHDEGRPSRTGGPACRGAGSALLGPGGRATTGVLVELDLADPDGGGRDLDALVLTAELQGLL